MTKRKNPQVDPAQVARASEAKAFAVMRAANAKAKAYFTALHKAPRDPATTYEAYMALYVEANAAKAEWTAACRAADAYRRETTPYDLANSFHYNGKRIQGIVHQFTYRSDNRDLAGHFNIWNSAVKSLCRIARECVKNCPALPELPNLPGNDYYAGMIHLANFCTKATEHLCADPTAAPKPRKSDTINGYIFEALQALPDAEKRRYQKGRKIYALVKEQHPTFDRAYRTFENYLAKLAKAEKIESNTGQKDAGYRLPQK